MLFCHKGFGGSSGLTTETAGRQPSDNLFQVSFSVIKVSGGSCRLTTATAGRQPLDNLFRVSFFCHKRFLMGPPVSPQKPWVASLRIMFFECFFLSYRFLVAPLVSLRVANLRTIFFCQRFLVGPPVSQQKPPVANLRIIFFKCLFLS